MELSMRASQASKCVRPRPRRGRDGGALPLCQSSAMPAAAVSRWLPRCVTVALINENQNDC